MVAAYVERAYFSFKVGCSRPSYGYNLTASAFKNVNFFGSGCMYRVYRRDVAIELARPDGKSSPVCCSTV